MSNEKKKTTRVDRATDFFKNNRLSAYLIVLGIIVVAAGLVAGGLGNVLDLFNRFRHDSGDAKTSVTVTLPADLTFRQAIELLAEDAKGVALFDPSCSKELVGAVVKVGTIRARTVVDLMEGLRYRLPPAAQQQQYKVKALTERGIYEISCKN